MKDKTPAQIELDSANKQSAIGFLIFALVSGAVAAVISFLAFIELIQ